MRDCKIILPVRCNAKCSFCFSKGTEYADDFLSEVSKSLNKINEPITANISGGEPSLYDNLLSLLYILKTNPSVKKIILTTNGSHLLEKREIAEYLTHLNISRHHYNQMINDELFGVHFDIDYELITEVFNRHGIDVRCNCYLSDTFESVNDLKCMVTWAADRGFSSIKFRNDFNSGMKMNKWEKMFKNNFKPVYEDSCPVCRVSQYLYRIPVFFGYGVPEPSDYEGTFEYVINQDGKLYWDYSCNKPVQEDTLQYLNKTYIGKEYGCGNTVYNKYRFSDGTETVERISSDCGVSEENYSCGRSRTGC